MKIYCNMSVIDKLGVKVEGDEKETMLNLRDHADGVIGALMLFETEEQAKAYNPKQRILEFEVISKDE